MLRFLVLQRPISRSYPYCKLRAVDSSILLSNLSLLLYGLSTLANSLEDGLTILIHLQLSDAAFAGVNADWDTLPI